MSAVTEFHLQSIRACGPCEQLVAKTDAEDGNTGILDGGSDMLDRLLHHGRITGSIGDEEAVVTISGEGWEVVVPRNDENLDSAIHKTSQLVVFETNVNTDNADRSA